MMNVWQASRRFLSLGLIAISLTIAAPAQATSIDCNADQFDKNAYYDWPTRENIFFVKSSGFIADRTFMAISLANGPSAPAKELAGLLTVAEFCPLQLTIAGQNEAKTLRVVKDAFGVIGKMELAKLDLTFVGSPAAATTVAKLVESSRGSFHTRLKLDAE